MHVSPACVRKGVQEGGQVLQVLTALPQRPCHIPTHPHTHPLPLHFPRSQTTIQVQLECRLFQYIALDHSRAASFLCHLSPTKVRTPDSSVSDRQGLSSSKPRLEVKIGKNTTCLLGLLYMQSKYRELRCQKQTKALPTTDVDVKVNGKQDLSESQVRTSTKQPQEAPRRRAASPGCRGLSPAEAQLQRPCELGPRQCPSPGEAGLLVSASPTV